MRVRPKLTVEKVLGLHEDIERDFPSSGEARRVALEMAHQLCLHYVVRLRRCRQLPDRGDVAKWNMLVDMVVLDVRTQEKMSFRDLARTVLGPKATVGSIDRLARKYSQRLRDCPGYRRRFDGLAQELQRESADYIDRLVREIKAIRG